jgi:D-glycero-alpha-D-manno-heptose-7-phosphate kinase
VEALHEIKRIAVHTVDALKTGDLPTIGRLLHESWQFKKQLAPGITTQTIDDVYALALRHGALGGKITGAGGGGFLLLYCPAEAQADVQRALCARGLQQMHFAFEFEGVRIVMNSGVNIPQQLGVRA